jgi:D-lactate dehydrogenase
MKIAFFDTHSFEWPYFEKLSHEFQHEINFIHTRLTPETAALATGCLVVCVFVNDQVNETVLQILSQGGTQLLALRCAGFNQVDLLAASRFNIRVVRIPAYSPYAVAEYAVALIQSINRKIHRAVNRVTEENFSLNGLVGFDLHRRTVGVVGTGRIGAIVAKILLGYGCDVLAHDLKPNPELKKAGVKYVEMEELLKTASVITLHLPLTLNTKHFINEETIALMHPGALLINTGRGELIDLRALTEALKTGHIGGVGLDIYEEDEEASFGQPAGDVLPDERLSRLITFPNVIFTAHQAYLTKESLMNVAETTLRNISDFENDLELKNEVVIPSS